MTHAHPRRFSPRASDATPHADAIEHDTPSRAYLPPALCTTGTYADKAREAIEFAERHRQLAALRRQLIRDVEARALAARHAAAEMPPPRPAEIETVTDARVAADPAWQSHIGDEQWGVRLATAYAALDSAETQREMLRYLR